jgi:uncharacterized protein YndB with AHSA1/START domain
MITSSSTDRIEKTIVLNASRGKVWRALTTAGQFGAWFGATLDGEFAEGRVVSGRIANPKYSHITLALTIERIVPEELFSYRWHPYAIDPGYDYSKDTPTLVEFRLADHANGVELTVTESGFDSIPVARRAEAFRMNSGGWAAQLANIERYVSEPS